MGLVKRLLLGVLLLSVLTLARYLYFRAGDDLLSGLTVGGVPVPSDAREALRALETRADVWNGTDLHVRASEAHEQRTVMRSSLGATLSVNDVFAQAKALGRSGNPLTDLKKWWDARRGRLDVRWVPNIDKPKLSAFVQQVQARVEDPPVAGVSDGQGFTLPGRDGRALDLATATLLVSRALRTGALEVELPLQKVPAPPPIAMGSPDGALFDQDPETPGPEVAPLPSAPESSTGYEPQAWLPANDNDCYEGGPQRPFCDGPRMVPAPYGAAQALAESLGLGKLETIARLIRQGPLPAWVQAAGGPVPLHELAWPVQQGKLGRGFGYVRKAELKDRIHAGIDIVAPRGSLIRASSPGIVAYSDNRVRGYGNLLAIVHDSGAVTLHAHCQRVFVFAGQRVQRGQVVGEVGMTGLAMGPHLHFEYHVAGAPMDPEPKFVGRP
jgi:hypothetical protein